MGKYKVKSDGSAPDNLSVGDEVVTGGGTYKITGIDSNGKYVSSKINDTSTYNYSGDYDAPPVQSSGAQSRYSSSNTPIATSKTSSDYNQYYNQPNVQRAADYVNSIYSSKPDAYSSAYQSQLSDIMDKITNREPFSYDLNGDALYQQYKDMYTQAGQNAMMDTAGQAAALTGGYGSTYASNSASQAYQSYLQQLNNIVPELYSQAYDRYNNEGNELYNMYSSLSSAEADNYNRYRDKMSDWYNNLNIAENAYNNALSNSRADYWAQTDLDYNKGVSDRNFDYNKYIDERDFNYNKDISDRNFNYNKYIDERDFNYNKEVSDRNFDYQSQRDAIADYQNQRNFDYNKYIDERNYNYNKEVADRNFNYNKYIDERDFNYKKSLAEQEAADENKWLQDIFGTAQNSNSSSSVDYSSGAWEGIDTDSVRDLGRGDLTLEELGALLESGEIYMETYGDEIVFKNK